MRWLWSVLAGLVLALLTPAASVSAESSWTRIGDLPTATQDGMLIALPDGRALEAGGVRNLRTFPPPKEPSLATALVFDPRSSGWKRVADMPEGHSNGAAVLLQSGEVLVIGGYADTVDTTTASTAIFDPKTSTWRNAAPMKQARAEMTATPLADGRVLVAGGIVHETLSTSPIPQPGSAPIVTLTTTAELFDPAAGTWAPAAALPAPRADQVSSLLPDGRVLLVGGTDGTNQVSTVIEYDPVRNAWIKLPPLSKAIGRAAVVNLADGRPLVVGDYGHLPTLSEVGSQVEMGVIAEILDDSSGAWRPAQSPPTQAISSSTAFLLPTGEAFFFGFDQSQSRGLIYDFTSDRWTVTPAFPVSVIYPPVAVRLPSGDLLVVMGNVAALFGSAKPVAGNQSAAPQPSFLESESTAFFLTVIALFLLLLLGTQRLRSWLVNPAATPPFGRRT